MSFINKQDSNGSKPALLEGEFGYDKQGSDRGRVYVGTNTGNQPLGKKSEIDTNTTAISANASNLNTHAGVKSSSTVFGHSKMSLSGNTLTIETV